MRTDVAGALHCCSSWAALPQEEIGSVGRLQPSLSLSKGLWSPDSLSRGALLRPQESFRFLSNPKAIVWFFWGFLYRTEDVCSETLMFKSAVICETWDTSFKLSKLLFLLWNGKDPPASWNCLRVIFKIFRLDMRCVHTGWNYYFTVSIKMSLEG